MTLSTARKGGVFLTLFRQIDIFVLVLYNEK